MDITKIEDFRRVSRKSKFLEARINAEEEARNLLNSKAGTFTQNEFHQFLDLSNTEIVPPGPHSYELRSYKTLTRFRRSFVGKNRNRMITTLSACNKWIVDLWRSQLGDSLIILDKFWEECRIKGSLRVDGAGIGFPTWIMYLKNPQIYNVWLRPLADAASTPIGTTFDTKQYQEFNGAVNKSLRQNPALKPPVEPQEIDYILFRSAKKS